MRAGRSGLIVLLIPLVAQRAFAAPPASLADAGRSSESIEARIAPPPGQRRVDLPDASFGRFLRGLRLLPQGSPVLLYNGQPKQRQDVHAAVVDLDLVVKRDLHQCADAVMHLYAEYLYAIGRPELIRFHPDPGKPRVLAYSGGRDRIAFSRYLVRLFAEAGSASLQAELLPVRGRPPQPGDVLIQGGYPGHAVLVLDAAEAPSGRRALLLGQSYMPAQQFHVLRNLGDPDLSPWYDADDLKRGLSTPEWRPFRTRDVYAFPPPP